MANCLIKVTYWILSQPGGNWPECATEGDIKGSGAQRLENIMLMYKSTGLDINGAYIKDHKEEGTTEECAEVRGSRKRSVLTSIILKKRKTERKLAVM